MAVGGNSSLDLNDLETELKEFKKSDWRKFGSEAGLSYNTLDEIVADNKGNTHQCFVECLSCWLKRKDNVDKRGKPSWSRLGEILDELDRTLADKIRSRKDVPIDVHKEQQVETVNTSGHNIC
uniref:Death domain-containing protein n=1 Tax=Amphimedon queenslandica TaxID=400682 RepID=A0A1X7SYV7_AMPQE